MNPPSFGSVVDVSSSGSMPDWNKLKAAILEKASVAESGYHIYMAICEAEESTLPVFFEATVGLGADVFEFCVNRQLDTIEFSGFDSLPDNLTGNRKDSEVKSLFSTYIRPEVKKPSLKKIQMSPVDSMLILNQELSS